MEGLLLTAFLAYFFYRSVWAFPFLLPLMIPYVRMRRRDEMERQKWELGLQFKEAIGFVAANLQAGYSIENAFRETYTEICAMFGKDSAIAQEWFLIVSGFKNNRTLEELLTEFARRSEVRDIRDFAEVFCMAKRNGGDFTAMIAACADGINGKTDAQREIRIAVAEKKFEYKIMCAVPFAIISYIGFTSPGFFDSLYYNLFGVTVMSVCLAVYLFAVWVGKRITDIRLL